MAAFTDWKIPTDALTKSDDTRTPAPIRPTLPAENGVKACAGPAPPTLLSPGPRQKHNGRRGRPNTPLVTGREVGPYVLLQRLGRGAQGDVWKAARLDSPADLVALKIMKPGLTNNPVRLAQFRREADRGIRLAGPSLLKVYELGEVDGHIFMAMPYVEGTPLHEVIFCRSSYLAGNDTEVNHAFAAMKGDEYRSGMIRLLARVARALARVHDHCIAHRDIKPANILLDKRNVGEVYLCDFGLGRDLEVATVEQMRDGAGTPMYMAPERLLKLAADEVKCDIYSLGVTLFEALTLERPFVVPDQLGLHGLAPYLASAPPRSLAAICPGFPVELEQIVMKAMAPEPGRRFDSARELASELERFELHASFRFSRASLRAPHWSRLKGSGTVPPEQSIPSRAPDLAPLLTARPGPPTIKLGALSRNDPEPRGDSRPD
ncbi:MAG: serine/threonine-protein kinase [Isosphaeraceae bacterium]